MRQYEEEQAVAHDNDRCVYRVSGGIGRELHKCRQGMISSGDREQESGHRPDGYPSEARLEQPPGRPVRPSILASQIRGGCQTIGHPVKGESS